MKHLLLSFLLISFLTTSCVQNNERKTEEEEKEMVRYDRPDASILKGVYIPSGKEIFYTSGLVAPVKNPEAEAGTYGRFGNTYEQSVGILDRIKETLEEGGFGIEDVFFLRVYLAPDKEGNIDWDAWFKAYGEYFNNDENANKVARSTIAVYALANPELLIEIEAVAAK